MLETAERKSSVYVALGAGVRFYFSVVMMVCIGPLCNAFHSEAK